ncbi:MAG: M48 family metalloprotease [Bacteroidota bacterium]
MIFPARNAQANAELLKPIPELRRSAFVVLSNALFFFICYLLLVCLSLGLVGISLWASIELLSVKVSFYSGVIVFGIMGLSLMVFVLLVKFIFVRPSQADEQKVRIYPKHYPELFSFIHQVAQEVGTKKPKKVFITPDVNATVSFNSTTSSLLFPTRKNLTIGLGLINCLTLVELKSVLAHEFGHFSQKSMRMGSYVHTVNRVINTTVFQYDQGDRLLEDWASSGGFFGLFGVLTIRLSNGIRQLLAAIYRLVLRQFSKLSLQMEYHADLVAGWATDAKTVTSALRKIELAQYAYVYSQALLDQYYQDTQKIPKDFFGFHAWAIQQMAAIHGGENLRGGYVLKHTSFEKLKEGKVHVQDIFESHPSQAQRENNLNKVTHAVADEETMAWTIMDRKESIREFVTGILLDSKMAEEATDTTSLPEFLAWYQDTILSEAMPEPFLSYFEGREISAPDENLGEATPNSLSLSQALGTEALERNQGLIGKKRDEAVLEEIALRTVWVRQFEYEQTVYKSSEARKVLRKVREQIEEDKKWLKQNDQ